MNAVDTNVYVYALDADEPIKQAKAVELLDDLIRQPAETVLLWQVAAEFLNQLRRWESAGRLTTAETATAFQRFRGMFPLHVPTEGVFQRTFELRSRFSLSHWDSMLLAACKEVGVTKLFSEDLDPGTDFDGLRVSNPFA
jgi:predicted nucleic acid-binding protein